MKIFISLSLMSIVLSGCFGNSDDNTLPPIPISPGVMVTPTATPTPTITPTPTPSVSPSPSPTSTQDQASSYRMDQPTSAPTSTCDGPYTLTAVDSVGSTFVLTADAQISLSADSPNMAIYSDAGCTEALASDTEVTIQSGSYSTQFYVQDSNFESAQVTLVSSITDNQTYTVAMTPGETASINISGDEVVDSDGTVCAGPFFAATTDFGGLNTADDLTVGGDVDGFGIYSDANCLTSISRVNTIAQQPSPYLGTPAPQTVPASAFYIRIPNITSSMTVNVIYYSNSNPVLEYINQLQVLLQSNGSDFL